LGDAGFGLNLNFHGRPNFPIIFLMIYQDFPKNITKNRNSKIKNKNKKLIKFFKKSKKKPASPNFNISD
jgi:hypothetical protein